MSARAYPLPRPENDDPRFTVGLHLDVAKVLQEHGFPKPSGVDLVDLGQALFHFLYATDQRPAPTPVETAPAVEDDSPLTLAEYRSALAYWEQKATEAKSAGLRGEFDRRMEGVVALRKSIRRLEGEPGSSLAVAQRAELHLDLSDEALAVLASHAGAEVAR